MTPERRQACGWRRKRDSLRTIMQDAKFSDLPHLIALARSSAAPQEPVAFYGPDKDDPTKGASLPMIPDSWRFRIREQGGAIFIEAQDNGPWIPYAAVEPYLSVPRVKRATGRIIPDLTGIEHVCKYQATIRAKDAAPQPQAPAVAQEAATYWLIERDSPVSTFCEWWVRGMGEEWTTDSFKAQRFNEDGARMHILDLKRWGVEGELRATEHIDCDGPDLTETP